MFVKLLLIMLGVSGQKDGVRLQYLARRELECIIQGYIFVLGQESGYS